MAICQVIDRVIDRTIASSGKTAEGQWQDSRSRDSSELQRVPSAKPRVLRARPSPALLIAHIAISDMVYPLQNVVVGNSGIYRHRPWAAVVFGL